MINLRYKRILGNKALKHQRHYLTKEDKNSQFVSEFVKLFNLKGKGRASHNELLQAYTNETEENVNIDSSIMTPLHVFDVLKKKHPRILQRHNQ